MEIITPDESISVLSDINSFADKAEGLINQTQSNYNTTRHNMLNRHEQEITSLEKSYRSNCQKISSQSEQALNDANHILFEIDALDKRLTSIDKYYRKTKVKKEEELASKTSPHYNEATDYFNTLEQIRKDFTVLYKKYSEDILPFLINGLNYLFSNKRKKDYEDLIILHNTVAAFVNEISDVLPTLTKERLSDQKQSYFSRKQELENRQSEEINSLETSYDESLDTTAATILANLDDTLPDEFVKYLKDLSTYFENSRLKVNSSTEIQYDILNMFFIDYPVQYFIQSGIVASIINNKCEELLVDGAIRLPIVYSAVDKTALMVLADNSNNTALQSFSHACIFNVLSSCPVSKLKFTVIDPENRGNSIYPFFDAKKKLPELFGDGIVIEPTEISSTINELNDIIEDILQEKLGTQYPTIYDYSKIYSNYDLVVNQVIIYDYPKGFDENCLAGLRNIIRNGYRCGIYVLIMNSDVQNTLRSPDYENSLSAIQGMCNTVSQQGGEFLLRGMPLVYHPMPDKGDFNIFFSKYLLIYEGIKNRGIAFSPFIRKLIEENDLEKLDYEIKEVMHLRSDSFAKYGHVPDAEIAFPESIVLGDVDYPADIFADSKGYMKIIKAFGKKRQVFSFSQVSFPLLFDLRNPFNVLIASPENTAKYVKEFTHHIMWSLLSYIPVTKVNICVADSQQRGNSILPFLDLRKKVPSIFGDVIYTNPDQIFEKLQSINSYIDQFIQDKLGIKYTDIIDYNIHTPRRAEPITLLVFYDFPAGLDGRGIDELFNIIRNGAKCGFYTIICHNPEVRFSRYESIDERLEDLQKFCISIDYKDDQYVLLPFNLPITLPEPLNPNTISVFTDNYVDRVEELNKKGISFEDILDRELFEGNTKKELVIPMGIGDEDAVVSLMFGSGTSHHGLIGGGTGGGKSTLLHTLIMSSMLRYDPNQINLYLMDFKGGTEFEIYESQRLPHIKLLALDAMQEFGESILENLVEELDQRSIDFKRSGGYTNIEDYVNGTGKKMPRILVIIDEFQILFDDSTNRKVAMNCAQLAKRIVTQGRSYGIHLLMATQSTNIISNLTLERGTIEQMRVRIGLKCGEDDTRYLFSDRYEYDAREKMKGPKGTAVLNEDYTEDIGNIGLRVAYCDSDLKNKYLKIVAEKCTDYACTTQVFEGARTESLIHYLESADIKMTSETKIRIHMGAKIKVADPFEIELDRKRKHNLLVCSVNESMTNNVVNDYMLSMLLNQNSTVYCIDGDTLVGDDSCGSLYAAFKNRFSEFHNAETRADIVQFVHDIYQIYLERKKHNEKGQILIVIKNLQYLDLVKSMFKNDPVLESEYLELETDDPVAEESMNNEDSNSFEDPFAAVNSFMNNRTMFGGSANGEYANEKMLKLIAEGSGFGIHFVVTSMEYSVVKETMRFAENILEKFPERVVFSLNDSDADFLIDGVSVASLRDNTVYYTDGIKDTFQFKPYVFDNNEVISYINTLNE